MLNIDKIAALILVVVSLLIMTETAQAQGKRALPPPDLGAQAGAQVERGDTSLPAIPPPPVTISAKLDAPSVPRDQIVRMIVTLAWEGPADEPLPPLDFEFPDPPRATGITAVGNSFRAETVLSGKKVEVTRTYTWEFMADKEGETEIKPASINYGYIGSSERGELSTGPLTVTVTKPKFNIKESIKGPLGAGILLVFIILASAMIVWPYLKAGKKKETGPEPVKSAHELFREKIKEIERLRMAGESGKYMSAMVSELSAYLKNSAGIDIKGAPAGKAGEIVSEELGPDRGEKVAELIRVADHVKFAGQDPTGAEMDLAATVAKDVSRSVEELESLVKAEEEME